MSLSPEEKAAGRRFLVRMEIVLDHRFTHRPPDYEVPSVLANFRHLCPARNHSSTALELREIQIYSAEYPGVPAGRWAFVYRDGTCRRCGQTALSRGRLVNGDRPPLYPRYTRSEMNTSFAEDEDPQRLPAQSRSQRGPTYYAPEDSRGAGTEDPEYEKTDSDDSDEEYPHGK